MEARVAELIVRYVSREELRAEELAYLRGAISRAELEALATGTQGRGGRSRLLYKLCNVLFHKPGSRKKLAPAAPSPRGMYPALKDVKRGIGGDLETSGGGANGTGKRR